MNRLKEESAKYRLLNYGSEFLTKRNALESLIGCYDKASKLLKDHNENLIEITKLSIPQLKEYKLTDLQITRLVSSFVMYKYMNMESQPLRKKINSSTDLCNIVYPRFPNFTVEHFFLIGINRNNKVLFCNRISTGGVSGTVVDVKVIMKLLLEYSCSCFALCHNHPSGNLKPSEEDIKITEKIKTAGEVMDIKLLDHIIIDDYKEYYSFYNEGML